MIKKLGTLFLFLLLLSCQRLDRTTPFSFEEKMPKQEIVTKPLRVGMLLDLTGVHAALGESMKQAALLAQFEKADDNFILQFYDTKGTSDGARTAAKEALDEGSQVILGPIFSFEVEEIKDLIERRNIPFISFTSDTSVLDKKTFSIGLSLEEQTHRILKYACSMGKTKIAVLYPETTQGEAIIQNLQKELGSCENMQIVRSVSYPFETINYEPYLFKIIPQDLLRHLRDKEKKLLDKKEWEKKKEETLKKIVELQEKGEETTELEKELIDPDTLFVGPTLDKAPDSFFLDFDALFIAENGNKLNSIAFLFSFYEITTKDVPFLGLSTWKDKSLSKEPSLIGALFPSFPDRKYKSFRQRYKDSFAKEPEALAGYAYDSVALIAKLHKEKTLTYESLTQKEGFEGLYGRYRLTLSGKTERLMNILEIRPRGRFLLHEKALDEFEDPLPLEETPSLLETPVSLDMPLMPKGETLPSLKETTGEAAKQNSVLFRKSQPSYAPFFKPKEVQLND